MTHAPAMKAEQPTGLTITVSDALVQAFAAFTGDHSSLHVDAEFGRRSRYNSTVVHGLLPILLLPAALRHLFGERSLRITHIDGQFLKPIFPNGTITIACHIEGENAGNAKVLFTIVNAPDRSVVTRGSVVVALDMPNSELQAGELSGTLLVDHLQEQDHRFEAVKQGDVASFDLRWGGDQLRAYEDLLRLVVQDAKEPLPTDVLRGRDPGAFAMLATLSTLVGMVMPGRSATFQEFSLTMDGPLQEAPAQATLRSTVSFRSSTINTFSQEVVIGSGSETYAHGKVTVLVAKTPFVPPTIQELAEGHQDMGLRNKVVLITGGSRGLGATTAKLFAVHGARVVINYRSSSAEAEELVAEIEAYGGEALAVQADVSSAAEVQRMVKEAVTHFGTIDVLVNGAASNFFPIPFLETTWDRIQDDLDVIVKGAFQVSQAVIPEFLRKGGGRIINISTIAVETPPPFQTKYVVAKSALNGLTRALAAEYAGQNILVNMVVPSLVETDFTSGFNQVALGKLKAASPLKRLAQAQEVADAIVFLASSRSSFTTGQKLMVTGGLPPLL